MAADSPEQLSFLDAQETVPDGMRALVDRLNQTAYAYYVLDDPLISDKQWDELYSRLQAMEKEHVLR